MTRGPATRWILAVAAGAALASPAAAAEEAPICTDRPAKANSVCTVPAGRLQIESDALSWTSSRSGGARTDTFLFTNPTLKLGLGPDTDIEVNFAPLVEVRTRIAGRVSSATGTGDLSVRLKRRLTDPESKFQLAILPFVKLPTAKRSIGNGRLEGGVAAPIQFTLSPKTILTFGPEIDVLADGDGKGHHVQLVALVNVSRSLSPRLTAYAELWTAQNYDPAGTTRLYSLDAALAYSLSPRLQLDTGANFGLNRATPDLQIYTGISTRF